MMKLGYKAAKREGMVRWVSHPILQTSFSCAAAAIAAVQSYYGGGREHYNSSGTFVTFGEFTHRVHSNGKGDWFVH